MLIVSEVSEAQTLSTTAVDTVTDIKRIQNTWLPYLTADILSHSLFLLSVGMYGIPMVRAFTTVRIFIIRTRGRANAHTKRRFQQNLRFTRLVNRLTNYDVGAKKIKRNSRGGWTWEWKDRRSAGGSISRAQGEPLGGEEAPGLPVYPRAHTIAENKIGTNPHCLRKSNSTQRICGFMRLKMLNSLTHRVNARHKSSYTINFAYAQLSSNPFFNGITNSS